MTTLQKEILEKLFAGGSIAAHGNNFRCRDDKVNPLQTFTYKTFYPLKKLLRKTKGGVFVLDKNKVRQLHGRSWAKKYYKSSIKKN